MSEFSLLDENDLDITLGELYINSPDLLTKLHEGTLILLKPIVMYDGNVSAIAVKLFTNEDC